MAESKISKVYSSFRADLDTLKTQEYILNSMTNPSRWKTPADAKQAQYAIYEGGYLRVFLKWETFVQDFLEEVFHEVCNYLIFTMPSLDPENKAFDKGTKLLDKAFENWEKEQDIQLSLRVQLVLDQDKWKTILKDYAMKACTGCTPILHSKRGIAKYLNSLFMHDGYTVEKKDKKCPKLQRTKPDESELDRVHKSPKSKPLSAVKLSCDEMAEKILQSKVWPGPKSDKSKIIPICMDCIVNQRISAGGDASRYKLKIDTPEALITITRLIYGVRCVLVHSKHDQTFDQSGGALYEFPDKEAFFALLGGSNENAKKQLYSLYERVSSMHANKSRKDGDEILHCDVVNIQRLVCLLASRFHNTIVELIEEHYGLHIWNEVDASYD